MAIMMSQPTHCPFVSSIVPTQWVMVKGTELQPKTCRWFLDNVPVETVWNGPGCGAYDVDGRRKKLVEPLAKL